jgi:hypothetical protein
VLISDGDGYLSVGCDGKDSLYLFNGIDLLASGVAEVVKEKMERAVMKDWECCVERYVDGNGEPVYRLFNTMLA